MAGSMIWGTSALPFLVGSSLGFTLGSFRWYDIATQEAMIQLRRHPALLQMHIADNFPWMPMARSQRAAIFNGRERLDWVRRSMLVVGWLSAGSALAEIRTRQEARLIDESVDGAATSTKDD
ncbi:hypothetical protein CC79DRAFT_1328632 [Sarocladium strictum]